MPAAYKNFLTSAMGMEVLKQRYLWKDKNGRYELPESMFRRVAATIAKVEHEYGASEDRIFSFTHKFFELMYYRTFLPNSPALMNAGRENGLLSACFVLPVPDSIDGIFDGVKNTALIQKSGGGTGFSFDSLRPTGDTVASSGGTTSGPISFWRVIAEATNAIQQGARRRGANMGMMSLSHPDILKFITAKRDTTAFTNFNISVKVSEAFMKQLQGNPDALLVVVNPRTGIRYVIPHSINVDSYTIVDLIPEDQASTTDCFTVREIWEMIITNAHATGEPGVCFIDRVNQDNPTANLGPVNATNPCGEQPLLDYEACNLGSINVSRFINKNKSDLDWNSLRQTVRLAVRFLDNVIDANCYPIDQIKEITLGNRKIGLGIMGFADTLILLGIRYDSEEAVEFAQKLSSFIQEHAHQASEELAKEKGKFPNWAGSVWDTKYHRPMRNAACTTIAPTGSISIIAACSSGIEPIYSIATKRTILKEREFTEIHPLVEELGTKEGWLTEKIRNLLIEGMPPRDILEIPGKLTEVLVTAHKCPLEWHVRIQAAFQENVDNAVSKTVNLPLSATVEDVDKIFRLAFRLGVKGITVFRDGCRDENQVLTTAHKTVQPETDMLSPRPRVRQTNGRTTKFRMGCGTLFVTVNKDTNGPCEVFANLGKAGGCVAQTEATCRAVSIGLRSGVNPKVLIEQLRGIRCLSTITRKSNKNLKIDVLSCPDAIARAIEELLAGKSEPLEICPANKCSDCSYPLRREAGCNVCDNCGYTKCG